MRQREMFRPNKIPDAYQPVSYIQATAYPSYIDTNYTPNQDTRVCVTAELIKNTQHSVIYGTEKPRFTLLKSRADYADTMGNSFTAMTTGRKYRFDQNKNIMRVERGKYSITDYKEFTCSKSLYLFALHGYMQDSVQFIGRIYTCKIYENNVLQRNYVPCFRKEDTVVGMYDLVESKFYPGNGTFIYG